MWEEVAQKITDMGGEIYLNCKVEKIIKENNRISRLECKYLGQTVELKGDIFVSSMPLKDLIVYMSNIPLDVFQIAEQLPYRDFVTMGILVDKLKIQNKTKIKTVNNIVPDCWIYVQEPDIKLGRIQIFNNWSPYLVSDKNKIWIGLEYFCNENDEFWSMTEEEIRIAAEVEGVQFIISSDAHTPDRVGDFKDGVERAIRAGLDLNRIVNIRKKESK